MLPAGKAVMRLSAKYRTGLVLFAFAGVAALDSPVSAYNETGHYYTVAAVTHQLLSKLPLEQASLVAFCAQLPDIAEELDATKVYRSMAWPHLLTYGRWAIAGSSWDDSVGRMVAVQQLLHALTGGQSQAIQTVAMETVDALATAIRPPQGGDSTALCALGFAMHLYGDSFAHRQLDDPGVMYPTGQGHARDFHRPDYILYELTTGSNVRAQAWRSYLQATPALLGRFTLDGVLLDQKTSEIMKLPSGSPKPVFRNTYLEGTIRTILARGLRLPDLKPPPEKNPSGKCQAYVAGVFKDKLFGSLPAPKCQDVWHLFRAAAEAAFNRTPSARDAAISVGYLDPAFGP